jgi:rod shape-determining protein MreC
MKTLSLQARGASLQTLFMVCFCITLMVVDHRFNHLEVVRSNISLALSPLRYLVSFPAQAGSWVSDWFTTHTELLQENDALKAEGRLINARLQKMRVLQEENTRLRSLLGSSSLVSDEVIVAELLSVDLNPYRQIIEINRGSSDGVLKGFAVIDEFGVMGQIVHVNPNSATVILISDTEHAIPVQIVRDGTRTVAFGNGSSDMLELRYLPATADIRIGDELVTSGLGGRFPADYPVAVISEINEEVTHGFISVYAKPKARLDSSREVLVIKASELVTHHD